MNLSQTEIAEIAPNLTEPEIAEIIRYYNITDREIESMVEEREANYNTRYSYQIKMRTVITAVFLFGAIFYPIETLLTSTGITLLYYADRYPA